jgi:hypothetical protein
MGSDHFGQQFSGNEALAGQGSGQSGGSFDSGLPKADGGEWHKPPESGSDLDLKRSQSAVALNELLRQHGLDEGSGNALLLQGHGPPDLGGNQSSSLADLPASQLSRTLMVIDQSIGEWRELVVNAPFDAELLLLDRQKDGVHQISDFLLQQQLSGSRSFDTIAIVSEGASAKLQLGKGRLESSNLSDYTEQLRSWRQALSPDADILIFGCNVGAGGAGAGFVQQLSQLTGAAIEA